MESVFKLRQPVRRLPVFLPSSRRKLSAKDLDNNNVLTQDLSAYYTVLLAPRRKYGVCPCEIVNYDDDDDQFGANHPRNGYSTVAHQLQRLFFLSLRVAVPTRQDRPDVTVRTLCTCRLRHRRAKAEEPSAAENRSWMEFHRFPLLHSAPRGCCVLQEANGIRAMETKRQTAKWRPEARGSPDRLRRNVAAVGLVAAGASARIIRLALAVASDECGSLSDGCICMRLAAGTENFLGP